MHPKQQLGGKKCGREMGKDTGKNGWEKGISINVEWREACNMLEMEKTKVGKTSLRAKTDCIGTNRDC